MKERAHNRLFLPICLFRYLLFLLENTASSKGNGKNEKEGDKSSSSKAIPNKHASSSTIKPIHESSMNSTKMISNFNRLTPKSHKWIRQFSSSFLKQVVFRIRGILFINLWKKDRLFKPVLRSLKKVTGHFFELVATHKGSSYND